MLLALLIAVLFSSFACPSVSAQHLPAFHRNFADDKNATVRILFVGNSILFVGETPEVLANIVHAVDPKQKIKISEVVGPAYSLKDHLDFGMAAEYILKKGPWDYIVIQQSTYDILMDPRQTLDASRDLVEIIRKTKAKPIFYETMGKGTMEYYVQQSAACHRVAKKLKLDFLPVASTLKEIHIKQPTLRLFKEDLNHYNSNGSYAAACVCYAKILGKNPTGIFAKLNAKTRSQINVKLDAASAKLIEETANLVVTKK